METICEEKARVLEALQHFFKPVPNSDSDDNDGDDSNTFEPWTFKDSSKVKNWTLRWVAHTPYLTFATILKGEVQDPLVIDIETKVTEFDHKGRDQIKMLYSSMGTNPYLFTIVVDVAENLFDPISLMESLSNSCYDEIENNEARSTRQEVGNERWTYSPGKVPSLEIEECCQHPYAPRNGGKVTATGSQMGSQQTGRSRGRAIVPSQGRGASATPTPLSPLKKKGLEEKTDKPKPKKDLLLTAEDLATSLNSVLVELSKVNKVGEVLDFDNANRIYQGFFADCQEEFVFKTNGQPKKFSVDVTRCKPAPAHWTIRAYEKRGMEEMKNYLVNMPDRTQKQTLYLMPDTKSRPQQEEDLRGCTFHIINGQHSVAASKSLIEHNANAYIVWTHDYDKLRKISAFYNRVNHLAPFKPTWASNILASRTVWVKYGKPQPKHAAAIATEPRTTGPKSNPASKTYVNFVEAIREHFAMIDVAKHQALVVKKGGKNTISLANELKIICSSDETWDLWKEVIASAACGGLIDPDTEAPHKKFYEKKGFVPDKDGTLPREFFKWLGNLTEVDHQKLCKHILHKFGPSRKYTYPKVVIKQNTNVLEDCYSVREWVERRKRKAVAQTELNNIKSTLHLFKRDGLDVQAWKHFKKAYHVSKESKHVLLGWGIPDSYWTNSRATQFCNKSAKDLSPYAVEFFKTFLKVRDASQSPSAQMWFLPFIREPRLSFGSWPSDIWRLTGKAVTFGIIDFRFLPTYKTRHNYTLENPFFMEFFKMIDDYGQPQFNDVCHWLLICGDDEDFAQVLTWVERNTLSGRRRVNSEYFPAPNERLAGHPPKSRITLEPVRLLFLIDENLLEPLSKYRTPDHPLYKDNRKFNKRKYVLYASELKMEFYLQVHDTFRKYGGAVYQPYGGTKSLMAATMLSILAFVVADDSDSSHMIEAQSLGLTLDPTDFSVDAYYVDKERFPEYGRAVWKGKGRAVEEGDNEELEEDAPTEEQTPSSSAGDISNEGDALPSDPVSQTVSEGGVGRRLDFPDVDITRTDDERPGSAPEMRSVSGRKSGGHKVHEEVDDLRIVDDVVMAQTADEPVRTVMDLDVTAHCALTLPSCVEVIPDDQPQDSLGSLGHVQDPDVVEGQAEDVQASGCDVSSSEELSPVLTRPQSGWLNVVLDLNGILCSSTPIWPGQSFVGHDLSIHSASKRAVVGPKLVCVRPNCADFLRRSSTFATITVWSSMKTSTTKMICDYLFGPIRPVYPLRILGQDDCPPVFMKEPGTQKDIFLKPMCDGLFRKFGGLYSEANTIFIDDSPIKHCQNNSYNVLLLSTWNNQKPNAADDSFLLKKLLPYLVDLHYFVGTIARFRAERPIEKKMYHDDRSTCEQYAKINEAISRRA
ncbi:hypothetical protein M758_UG120800 [Ceratodon purpureus]|nr:hypothetical protein M758_UG120800 [Ceratodon purpureus]